MKNSVFNLQLLVWCTAFMLLSSVAHADSVRGCCSGDDKSKNWYVSVTGGIVYLNDVNISHSNPLYTQPDGQTFRTGKSIAGSIGYKVLSGVRTEVEFAVRDNTVKYDNAATNALPAGSRAVQTSTALILNAYVDLHNKTHFTPYLGAGIGQAYVRNPRYYTDNGTGEVSEKLSAWAMCYQIMTGVNYEIRDFSLPFDISMGYRYFTTDDVKMVSTLSNYPSQLKFPNTSHNFELGFRFYF